MLASASCFSGSPRPLRAAWRACLSPDCAALRRTPAPTRCIHFRVRPVCGARATPSPLAPTRSTRPEGKINDTPAPDSNDVPREHGPFESTQVTKHPRSEELYERACRVIPGGVNSPVRAFKAVGGIPLFIQRGEGQHLVDA